MFIESHKAALSSFDADIEPYMVDGVVADSEGALSVMLPLARNTIAIKFAENDHSGAFPKLCVTAYNPLTGE